MDKSGKYKQEPILDFFKGAMKGVILTGLMLGLTWAVGVAIPGAALLPEGFKLLQGVGIMLVSGILNGGMSVYHGAKIQKQMQNHTMRDAHIVESSPTIVPLLGVGHGVSVEHALEIEDTQASQKNWAASTERKGDRIQEILRNGSMSDKDRASAILQEREALAATQASR